MGKSLFKQAVEAAQQGKLPAAEPEATQPETQAGITVRATLRLRNDSMIAARKRIGLSQIKLAAATSMPLYIVTSLEKFDFSHARLAHYAARLATFLELPLEVILPPELIGRKLQADIVAVKRVEAGLLLGMHERFTQRFTLPSPVDVAEENEHKDQLGQLLQVLTEREREIVKARHGIDGPAYSLEELGRRFNVTRQRVKQIDDKAFRKLQGVAGRAVACARHPKVVRRELLRDQELIRASSTEDAGVAGEEPRCRADADPAKPDLP